MKAAAVEISDQALQTTSRIAEPQLTPTTLGGQGLTPALHLLHRDTRWRRLGRSRGTTTTPGFAPAGRRPLQELQAAAQLQHFTAQGLIFSQQGIDVGGDPPGLRGSRGPLTWIKPHRPAASAAAGTRLGTANSAACAPARDRTAAATPRTATAASTRAATPPATTTEIQRRR